ncbi:hypothetical protein [Glaciibacter sp. 2TAF33]|uniref:hypothetical protein n=1 Tax=Glaciibacter sp. 2TAF33 TaxID=3233015 RepID=UPI003F935EC2
MTGSVAPAWLVAAVLASALLLTGCTAGGANPATPATSAPAPTSTTAPTASVAPAAVTPVVPDPLTEESITNESTRLAEAIRALIDSAVIVNVDDHAQVVEKTASAGRYYGIIRTITLDPKTDAATVATEMVGKLMAAGWISRDSSSNGSTELSALASGEDPATSWFVIIGADASVPGESVLTIQLASPDLP